MSRSLVLFFGLLLWSHLCFCAAKDLTIVNNKKSGYAIIIPSSPSVMEQRSAAILQHYLLLASGVQLPIVRESLSRTSPGIYIGYTQKNITAIGALPAGGYRIQVSAENILIDGNGSALLQGIYHFTRTYLHCEKIAADEEVITRANELTVPAQLKINHKQDLQYREVYYPSSQDTGYLAWQGLQTFEQLWGLWGHSFNKLVPPDVYFKMHPEYFALVNGVRQPTQLCLSNEAVFDITCKELKKRMAANIQATYWSVSPNDNDNYCTCALCKRANARAGSPSGSLLQFVNRVAVVFPDAKITTLAYGYTHKAPKNIKLANNVIVFVSSIDAYRDKPLSSETSAATFRTDINAWRRLTPNIFVWDYVTQFSNYLAPFPNFVTLQPNIRYMKGVGVKGIFEQGSGATNGEWGELRSYVTARLLDDDKANTRDIMSYFLDNYYGTAGRYLLQYISLLQEKMQSSGSKPDIYGSPVHEWNTYLTPELMDRYSSFFDKAIDAAKDNPKFYARVIRARLPIEYVLLQQARFFGIRQGGIFKKNSDGEWIVKPELKKAVTVFVANCKKGGVQELSEGGATPDGYQAEWNRIWAEGVMPTKALNMPVALKYPALKKYTNAGAATLTDGNPGYQDISYNWLCFAGVPMEAIIDLGKETDIESIKMHFLEDATHDVFLPSAITAGISSDGIIYKKIASLKLGAGRYAEPVVKKIVINNKAKARFVKITAQQSTGIIACDEIYVQ
jgi:hypothetical protein